MLNKKLILVLIVILVPGILLASGCRRPGPHGAAAYFMVDYIAETLDLRDAQREQLNGIKDELLEKAKALREGHQSLREEIMVQLKSDAVDRQKLKDMVAEKRARMDEVISLVIDRLAEFHQTLTLEQKTKLVDKIQSFIKFHHPGWG